MATPMTICSLLASCFGKCCACCKNEDEGKSNTIKTTFMCCVSAETIQLDAKDGSEEEEEEECAAKVEANLSSTRKRGSLHKEQETST